MKRLLRALLVAAVLPVVAALVLLQTGPAAAAGLTRVTNFGTNPTDLNMYVYAPEPGAAAGAAGARPLLRRLGSGIFNGNGHDFVTAADRYGYIIVVPEATRSGHCFDVSTAAALRRNGGSDSTGIMSMVSWARTRNTRRPGPDRVSAASPRGP